MWPLLCAELLGPNPRPSRAGRPAASTKTRSHGSETCSAKAAKGEERPARQDRSPAVWAKDFSFSSTNNLAESDLRMVKLQQVNSVLAHRRRGHPLPHDSLLCLDCSQAGNQRTRRPTRSLRGPALPSQHRSGLNSYPVVNYGWLLSRATTRRDNMARASWSGFLSFGPVSIPVGHFSATADEFHGSTR